MDTITSTEFRKLYASLTRPMVVTVQGHPIGQWIPVSHPQWTTVTEMQATLAEVRRDAQAVAEERFNTRPFTPVPKTSHR